MNRFNIRWRAGATLLSIVMLAFFTVSLILRRINGDEGIIGEWAYWLANYGQARSMLYYSYFGEKALSLPIYHKFYTLLLVGFVKVFDFEPFYLRIPSLISYAGLISLIGFYLRIKRVKLFSWYILAGFFLSQSLLFNFAFLARPELLMALFSFATFFILRQYTQSGDWRWALLAGLISGLSFYTHLNGLAIVVAAGIFLLFHFQWKALISFGMSAFAMASLFVIDIPGTYLGLLNELSQAPDVKNSSFSLGRILMKLLTEHERFFHNAGLAVFSSATILSLIFSWKQLRRNDADLLLFLLFMILSLSLLTHGKTAKYLLFYMPFMGLIILQSVNYLFLSGHLRKVILISVLIIVGAGITIGDYLKDFSYFVPVKDRNQAMAQLMEKGTTVMAHDGFVFGQLEQFEIRSPIIFFFKNEGFRQNEMDDSAEFLTFAAENDYDYVAVDLLLERDDLREIFSDAKFETGYRSAGYQITYKDADFMIFKRLK